MQEAKSRWLKPPEVLFILQNYEQFQITQQVPQKPPSNFCVTCITAVLSSLIPIFFDLGSLTGGSLFIFNKRVLRYFRKDGYSWRKKKDGRTVGEAHERLKVCILCLF